MGHPFKRGDHPAWLKRQKFAEGGAVDAPSGYRPRTQINTPQAIAARARAMGLDDPSPFGGAVVAPGLYGGPQPSGSSTGASVPDQNDVQRRRGGAVSRRKS